MDDVGGIQIPIFKAGRSVWIYLFIFCCFRTGFRFIKGGRLIRLIRRGMHTGQVLFLLGIEPGISRVPPWKELLATGVQTYLSILAWQKNSYVWLLTRTNPDLTSFPILTWFGYEFVFLRFQNTGTG